MGSRRRRNHADRRRIAGGGDLRAQSGDRLIAADQHVCLDPRGAGRRRDPVFRGRQGRHEPRRSRSAGAGRRAAAPAVREFRCFDRTAAGLDRRGRHQLDRRNPLSKRAELPGAVERGLVGDSGRGLSHEPLVLCGCQQRGPREDRRGVVPHRHERLAALGNVPGLDQRRRRLVFPRGLAESFHQRRRPISIHLHVRNLVSGRRAGPGRKIRRSAAPLGTHRSAGGRTRQRTERGGDGHGRGSGRNRPNRQQSAARRHVRRRDERRQRHQRVHLRAGRVRGRPSLCQHVLRR